MKHYTKLKDGEVKGLMFPNIKSLMTGVYLVHQDKYGNITLTYTDNTTESRASETDIEEFGDMLKVVSFVQAGREVTQ